MPATKNFPVFDCDSHVVEPPLVWEEYVPARERAWVKSQFCFHTDGDLLMINGRVVPASRERSNVAEVGWARWAKSEIGAYTPGSAEWTAAVLESNASWLPLVLGKSKGYLDLFAFQRNNRKIRDPRESFHERCFIGFESDEELVYRLWDEFQDIGIWSSDYPHHDAEDAWEALDLMNRHDVPAVAQEALMGENARRLYGIEPVMRVTERVEDYQPAILPW